MNTKTAITIVLTGVVIAGLFFVVRTPEKNQNEEKTVSLTATNGADEIVSQQGIHWHPELSITIKGEKEPIPANIGIGMQFAGYPQYDSMMMMTNMHTHDASGMIHWEVMKGPVRQDDIKLSQFFSVWGKKFASSCIFDKCNGPEGRVVLKINGKDNPDFENYLVKDGDKIEIIFE